MVCFSLAECALDLRLARLFLKQRAHVVAVAFGLGSQRTLGIGSQELLVRF